MADTVIGSTMRIDGEVSGNEPLVVLGAVRGRIALDETVFVEAEGAVEADVRARSVVVAGAVTGNIQALDRIEIKPAGRMLGDIRAPRVHIADGAVFKGKIEMEVSA